MDNSKSRTISLNLKQIQTVDISKLSTKDDRDESSSKLSKNNKIVSSNSSKPQQSNKEQQKRLNSSLTDTNSQNETRKPTNTQTKTSTNPSKKLKVPFEVKLMPTNPAKVEPKYSKENQNLRLLNKVDDSRRELLINKITKEKVQINRINLKNITTTNDTNQAKLNNINLTGSVNQNKLNNSTNKNFSFSNLKKSQLLSEHAPNRLVNLYLKNLPDQFNYLDNDPNGLIELQNSKINDLQKKLMQQQKQLSSKTIDSQRNKSSNYSNNEPTTSFNNQSNRLSNQVNKSNKNSTFNSSDLSSQFLKNQKQSLEVEELIKFKIKNDDEKKKIKDSISHLMQSLIEFKQSTYTPNLVEDLNSRLKNVCNRS